MKGINYTAGVCQDIPVIQSRSKSEVAAGNFIHFLCPLRFSWGLIEFSQYSKGGVGLGGSQEK